MSLIITGSEGYIGTNLKKLLDSQGVPYIGFDRKINYDFLSPEEQAEIRAICQGDETDDEDRWGEGWIYDGDHNWEIEDDSVIIYGPLRIDLVDEYSSEVIAEDVGTYKEDDPKDLLKQGYEE